MRFFDDDHIGCYLDKIAHRIDRTSDGETKMVDLTVRVQPLTPELAGSLDPDVRALLFGLGDASPRPKIKALHLALTVPPQRLMIRSLPELEHGLVLSACTITGCRARTQKDVDGYVLIFHVSYGPASPAELEYVCDWLSTQRFVSFELQAPALDFGPSETVPPPARRRRGGAPILPGDELRPGVAAEH